MSRVEDLVSLIESANDVYLINPKRNVRSAYIQIDDICELTMKSWLQSETVRRQQQCQAGLQAAGVVINNRQRDSLEQYFADNDYNNLCNALNFTVGVGLETTLSSITTRYSPTQNWSPDNSRGFKNFQTIIREVKDRFPAQPNQPLHIVHSVLGAIQGRRDNRNRFFHDQNQTGLTVDDASCLNAFHDLYRLNEFLYGPDFIEAAKANAVVQAQIVLIKLRRLSATTKKLSTPLQEILGTSTVRIIANDPSYEYHILHDDPTAFFDQIRTKFTKLVTERSSAIIRINGFRTQTAEQREKLVKYQAELDLYSQTIQECLN